MLVDRHSLDTATPLALVTVSTTNWTPALVWVYSGAPWHLRFDTELFRLREDFNGLRDLRNRASCDETPAKVRSQPMASLKKRTLNLVGYWIREPGDESFVPPQELIGSEDEVDYDRIADYLAAAPTYRAYRGMSWCRFGCAESNGYAEQYDGEWIWPQGLAHYVRVHHLRLPLALEARAVSATTPAVRPPSDYEIDEVFWIDWCAEHRSGALVGALAETDRRRTAARITRRNEKIRRAEEKTGLSELVCQRAGCDRQALRGKALCASCIAPAQDWERDGAFGGPSLVEVLNG